MTGAGDGGDPGRDDRGRRGPGPARPWETLGIAALLLLVCGVWGLLLAAFGVRFDGTLNSTVAVMAPPVCLVAALVVQGQL